MIRLKKILIWWGIVQHFILKVRTSTSMTAHNYLLQKAIGQLPWIPPVWVIISFFIVFPVLPLVTLAVSPPSADIWEYFLLCISDIITSGNDFASFASQTEKLLKRRSIPFDFVLLLRYRANWNHQRSSIEFSFLLTTRFAFLLNCFLPSDHFASYGFLVAFLATRHPALIAFKGMKAI